MVKKYHKLLLTLLPITVVPFAIACQKEVDYFSVEEFDKVSFEANINFSVVDIKNELKTESKENLLVGNFTPTDVKSNFQYSFIGGNDADLFEVDNNNDSKFIYLKRSKFAKVLESDKEVYSFEVKAEYDGKYILKKFSFPIDLESELVKVNLYTDKDQPQVPAQNLNIDKLFKIDVNLEPRDRGTVISNNAKNPNKVSKFGALDNLQTTFYSPVDLSQIEKEALLARKLPVEPEIVFTSKDEAGVYVSNLEAYLVSGGVNPNENSLLSILYQPSDSNEAIRIENLKDTRIDTELIPNVDPSGYNRGVRYGSINAKVKWIKLIFNSFDSNGLYPYVSEIKLLGKAIDKYTQVNSNQLSDKKYETYLLSNPLSSNNVTLVKNSKVLFNFNPSDSVKIKQIQLYKAPVAYKNEIQTGSAWKIRPAVLAKYKYVVTFEDGKKIGFEINGTGWEKEIFNLPVKYQDKAITSVTLISDSILELKEIVFA